MDEADIAQAQLEREMTRLIAHRRETGPAPTGYCLWCGEPVPPTRRWCDVECRDAWERDHARRTRP